MFRVKCKDERKRRNDRLGEGGSIFPYIKNTKVFLENLPIFSENTKVFLKNTKVFLQQESVSKRNRPIPSSAVGAGFACPKTQNKLFSGERTSPLPTKRQYYPPFDTPSYISLVSPITVFATTTGCKSFFYFHFDDFHFRSFIRFNTIFLHNLCTIKF